MPIIADEHRALYDPWLDPIIALMRVGPPDERAEKAEGFIRCLLRAVFEPVLPGAGLCIPADTLRIVHALRQRDAERQLPECAYVIFLVLLDGVGKDVNDVIRSFGVLGRCIVSPPENAPGPDQIVSRRKMVGVLVDVLVCIAGLHFLPLEMQILTARWLHGDARLVTAQVRREEPTA